MLFMYYPFRDEKELLSGNPSTYASKLSESGVTDLVNQNYSLVEPFATIVDNVFLSFFFYIKHLHLKHKKYTVTRHISN